VVACREQSNEAESFTRAGNFLSSRAIIEFSRRNEGHAYAYEVFTAVKINTLSGYGIV
jgi:hypothetical protein